jgi:hypothetical protein
MQDTPEGVETWRDKKPPEGAGLWRLCIGLALATVGVVAALCFLAAASESHFSGKEVVLRANRFEKDGSCAVSFNSEHNGRKLDRGIASVGVLLGTAVAALGLFLGAVQYSLRALVLATLIAGALATLPHNLLAPGATTLRSTVTFQDRFTSEQLADMRLALQPRAAVETLPPGLRKELGLAPECIARARVDATAGREAPGATLTVTFAPQLTEMQENTLIEFYAHYFDMLAIEAATANGWVTKATPQRSSHYGTWFTWTPEWEQERAKKAAGQ